MASKPRSSAEKVAIGEADTGHLGEETCWCWALLDPSSVVPARLPCIKSLFYQSLLVSGEQSREHRAAGLVSQVLSLVTNVTLKKSAEWTFNRDDLMKSHDKYHVWVTYHRSPGRGQLSCRGCQAMRKGPRATSALLGHPLGSSLLG